MSCIDNYIYVPEKNIGSATDYFKKKKRKKIVTILAGHGLVTFSRKSFFLQDSKTCSFIFAFSKFLTKER